MVDLPAWRHLDLHRLDLGLLPGLHQLAGLHLWLLLRQDFLLDSGRLAEDFLDHRLCPRVSSLGTKDEPFLEQRFEYGTQPFADIKYNNE